MEIAFLNKDFELLQYVKFINLQWIRCYYEPGQFSLQMSASDYRSDARYIYADERPEVGIIQKWEYADGYDGSVVQISGYFYEFKLNDKVVYPRFLQTGNIETLARLLVSTYKSDIPILYLDDANDPLLGETLTKEITGDGLAKALYEMLKTQEMSYRCRYDYVNNKMLFGVWKGLDRTQEQSTNSFVTFSTAFKNISNENTTIDQSAYKNYAIVIGNGKYEEGNQIRVDVDLSGDDYQQILYVDETGMNYNSSEQTLDEYKASLYQAGLEALEKYVQITNVKFDTIERGLVYMEDYDLGDKCDIVLDSIQAAYTSRIIEVDEVWKENKHTVTLQFGEKKPTVYSRARR